MLITNPSGTGARAVQLFIEILRANHDAAACEKQVESIAV